MSTPDTLTTNITSLLYYMGANHNTGQKNYALKGERHVQTNMQRERLSMDIPTTKLYNNLKLSLLLR